MEPSDAAWRPRDEWFKSSDLGRCMGSEMEPKKSDLKRALGVAVLLASPRHDPTVTTPAPL
jgi:hypothetical protein